MADQKLSALSQVTTAQLTDLLYIVTSNASPASYSINRGNLVAGLASTATTITAVYPLTGGGSLAANRSLSVDTAFLANTGSLYFAGSGLSFITYTAEANLPSEKVLTAGSSVTIVTDATAIYINALTNAAGGVVYAPTGGKYIAYGADADLSAELILQPGSSVTLTSDATSVYVNAITNAAGGVTYASTGGYYIMAQTNDATLLNSKLLLAGSSVVVHTDGGAIYVDATTANALAYVLTSRAVNTTYPLSGGATLNADRTIIIDTAFLVNTGSLIFAGSGMKYVTWGSEANLSAEKTLTAGSSVTLHTDATAIYINATTATNVSNVTTGSSQYLGFYKAADNSIYPSHVSESTGTGIAQWNVPLLAADPAGSSNGDVWFLSSGGSVYLRVNTNNTILTLTFA